MRDQNGILSISRPDGGFQLFISIVLYLFALQFTYLHLRNDEVSLYFASYLTFDEAEAWRSIGLTCLLVPALFLVLARSVSDLFALLLAPLIVIGGASGTIVLAYHDFNLAVWFFGLYVLLPTFLLFVPPPAFSSSKERPRRAGGGLLLGFGIVSVVIFSYLAWKYWSLLGLPAFGEVYEYRSAFDAVVSPWERYAITFGKLVGSFCLAAYAIATRRRAMLLGSIFILLVDYGLAGHKSSVAFLIIICACFFFFTTLGWQYRPLYLVLPLVIFLVGFNVLLWVGASAPEAIAIYDRVFNVTSGLFVRYVDYANIFGFFSGGPGLLGKLFNGRDQNYYELVGEYFFSKGVSANADLISDAYINFGSLGAIISLVVLRLLFSTSDNAFYARCREPLLILMVPYSLALFSMGLQTALVTGGLVFGVFLVKVRSIPIAQ